VREGSEGGLWQVFTSHILPRDIICCYAVMCRVNHDALLCCYIFVSQYVVTILVACYCSDDTTYSGIYVGYS